MKRRRAVIVAALVIALLAIAPSLHDAAGFHNGYMPDCGGLVTENCLVSFTVANAAVPGNVGQIKLQWDSFAGLLFVMAWNTGGPLGQQHELGPTLTTSSKITLVIKPAATFAPTAMMSMGELESWSWNAGTHELTVVGYPRSGSWTNAACDTGGCNVQTADFDFNGIFMFQAFDIDVSQAPPEAQAIAQQFKANLFGGHISTNAQAFTPPDYDQTTQRLTFVVGAPHCKNASPVNGCTLNTGFFNAFVPDTFITNIWGISPSSLTSSNTQVIIQGQGTAIPAVTPVAATPNSPAGLKISYAGFTFSTPKIEIAKTSSAAPPAAEISLPSVGAARSTMFPARVPGTGIVPVELTLQEQIRGAELVVAPATQVTWRTTGAAYRGLLYVPSAIQNDPIEERLVSPTSFGAEGAARASADELAFSAPITMALPIPAVAEAAALQPARLVGTEAILFLTGRSEAGYMRFETDRLGVYGLARPATAGAALQLPPSGVMLEPVTIDWAGARLDLAPRTFFFDGRVSFVGEIARPVAVGDPTNGGLSSVVSFGTSGTDVRLSSPATITLPVPAGMDPAAYRPVSVDPAGRLTYLDGFVVSGGVAFTTARLGTFGLATTSRPR